MCVLMARNTLKAKPDLYRGHHHRARSNLTRLTATHKQAAAFRLRVNEWQLCAAKAR